MILVCYAQTAAPSELSIIDSNFEEIKIKQSANSAYYLISDRAGGSDINIVSTKFIHLTGPIFQSQHTRISNIYIRNLSIISSPIYSSSNYPELLSFNSYDTVNISGSNLFYHYSVTENCKAIGNISNKILNETCEQYSCLNTVPFIINLGSVYIQDMKIFVNISDHNLS